MKLTDIIRKRYDLPDEDEIRFAASTVESSRMKAWPKTDKDHPPTFSGIATSAAVDLEDEVVVPKGLDWSYALQWRYMYPSHKEYGIGPIAVLNNVSLKEDGWYFSATWVKSNPVAEQFYNIAKETGILGVSIGFKVLESGRPTSDEVKQYGPHKSIVRRGAVIELSPTFMPANPDAVVSMKSGRCVDCERQKDVERLVGLGRVHKDTYAMMTPATRTIVLLS
jgi:phage head maturation protease